MIKNKFLKIEKNKIDNQKEPSQFARHNNRERFMEKEAV